MVQKFTAEVCEHFQGEQIKLLSSTEEMQVYADKIPELEKLFEAEEAQSGSLTQAQKDLGTWVANCE